MDDNMYLRFKTAAAYQAWLEDDDKGYVVYNDEDLEFIPPPDLIDWSVADPLEFLLSTEDDGEEMRTIVSVRFRCLPRYITVSGDIIVEE